MKKKKKKRVEKWKQRTNGKVWWGVMEGCEFLNPWKVCLASNFPAGKRQAFSEEEMVRALSNGQLIHVDGVPDSSIQTYPFVVLGVWLSSSLPHLKNLNPHSNFYFYFLIENYI